MSRIMKQQMEAQAKRNKYTFLLNREKEQSGHAAEIQSGVASLGQQTTDQDSGIETELVRSRSTKQFSIFVMIIVGIVGFASILLNVKLLSQITNNRNYLGQLKLDHEQQVNNLEKTLKETNLKHDTQLENFHANLIEVNQTILEIRTENSTLIIENKELRSDLNKISGLLVKNDEVIAELIKKQGALQAQITELYKKNKILTEKYGAITLPVTIAENHTVQGSYSTQIK